MTRQKNQKHIGSSFVQMRRSSKICANQVQNLIEYVRSVDPELKWHEAINLAAAIVSALPSSFERDPGMMADLKTGCQNIKAQRKARNAQHPMN